MELGVSLGEEILQLLSLAARVEEEGFDSV
jgi:hypothetical protein